jgi:V/A-type H+/Na+-transporting ATPase subunit E
MATIIGSGLEGYLHRQARKRALNLIAEAKEEARGTLEQATAEIEAMRLRIRAETGRTIEDDRRRAVAQARLQAKLLVTNRIEGILAELWDRAATELQRYAEAGSEERLEMIARLTQDAAEQLGGGTLDLVVNAADRPLLTPEYLQALAQHLPKANGSMQLILSPDEAPIWGGVIVYRRDANQLVDNSLDERLALVQRTMRDEVARLLTPSGDAEGEM